MNIQSVWYKKVYVWMIYLSDQFEIDITHYKLRLFESYFFSKS